MSQNGAHSNNAPTGADRAVLPVDSSNNNDRTAQSGVSGEPIGPLLGPAGDQSRGNRGESRQAGGHHGDGHGQERGGHGGNSGTTSASDAAMLALAQLAQMQANQTELRERREHELRMRQLDLAVANANSGARRGQGRGQNQRRGRGRGARQSAPSTRERQGNQPVEEGCRDCRNAGRRWNDHDPWNCAALNSHQRSRARDRRQYQRNQRQTAPDPATTAQEPAVSQQEAQGGK